MKSLPQIILEIIVMVKIVLGNSDLTLILTSSQNCGSKNVYDFGRNWCSQFTPLTYLGFTIKPASLAINRYGLANKSFNMSYQIQRIIGNSNNNSQSATYAFIDSNSKLKIYSTDNLISIYDLTYAINDAQFVDSNKIVSFNTNSKTLYLLNLTTLTTISKVITGYVPLKIITQTAKIFIYAKNTALWPSYYFLQVDSNLSIIKTFNCPSPPLLGQVKVRYHSTSDLLMMVYSTDIKFYNATSGTYYYTLDFTTLLGFLGIGTITDARICQQFVVVLMRSKVYFYQLHTWEEITSINLSYNTKQIKCFQNEPSIGISTVPGLFSSGDPKVYYNSLIFTPSNFSNINVNTSSANNSTSANSSTTPLNSTTNSTITNNQTSANNTNTSFTNNSTQNNSYISNSSNIYNISNVTQNSSLISNSTDSINTTGNLTQANLSNISNSSNLSNSQTNQTNPQTNLTNLSNYNTTFNSQNSTTNSSASNASNPQPIVYSNQQSPTLKQNKQDKYQFQISMTNFVKNEQVLSDFKTVTSIISIVEVIGIRRELLRPYLNILDNLWLYGFHANNIQSLLTISLKMIKPSFLNYQVEIDSLITQNHRYKSQSNFQQRVPDQIYFSQAIKNVYINNFVIIFFNFLLFQIITFILYYVHMKHPWLSYAYQFFLLHSRWWNFIVSAIQINICIITFYSSLQLNSLQSFTFQNKINSVFLITMNLVTFFYCFLFYPFSYRYEKSSMSMKLLELSQFHPKGFWLEMSLNCLYIFIHSFGHGTFINNHQIQIFYLIIVQISHITIILLLRLYFKHRISFFLTLCFKVMFLLFNILIYCYSFIPELVIPYNFIFIIILLILIIFTILKILFAVSLILYQVYQKIINFMKQKKTDESNIQNYCINKNKIFPIQNMRNKQKIQRYNLFKIHEQSLKTQHFKKLTKKIVFSNKIDNIFQYDIQNQDKIQQHHNQINAKRQQCSANDKRQFKIANIFSMKKIDTTQTMLKKVEAQPSIKIINLQKRQISPPHQNNHSLFNEEDHLQSLQLYKISENKQIKAKGEYDNNNEEKMGLQQIMPLKQLQIEINQQINLKKLTRKIQRQFK